MKKSNTLDKSSKGIKSLIMNCDKQWDSMTEEQKDKYNLNVYYPIIERLEDLNEHENIDMINYIKISFDTYKGRR